MIDISFVPKEYVDSCWEQIEDYLKGAADYTHGRYEVRDIYWAIVDYDHQLWIAFDGDEIKGAVVTNIVNYPRKRYLCMSFCGGIELEKWKDPMLKMLRHWAFDNRCDGIEATARPGWAKIFKNDGHVPLWHTFELPSGSKGLKNG